MVDKYPDLCFEHGEPINHDAECVQLEARLRAKVRKAKAAK